MENEINFNHIPIMLNDVLSGLNINPDGIYIDCTLGGGGHSSKILEKLSPRGLLIGLDKDQDALDYTNKKFERYTNFKSFHTDFKQVNEVLDYLQIDSIDGALLDLGVSSYQIDTRERGFSFRFDATLDMRMDKSQKLTAYDVVNNYTLENLTKIFFEYGEEEYSRQIAKNIVKQRELSPIKTTKELAEIIENSMPKRVVYSRGGAEKKVFQAIRIEVNGELDGLYETILFLAKKLKSGGRIAVLTFHSLEDRIIKQAFKELTTGCKCPPKTPVCICGHKAIGKLINKKPIIATDEEIKVNPRSTSAKLRIFERE